MNLKSLVTALLPLFSSLLGAQTTGTPANNLDVRLPPTYVPLGASTTSCNFVGLAVATPPYTIAYDAIAPGATNVFLALGMGGCTPAGLPFLPTAAPACAGPLAGAPLTNLWFSLNFSGPWPIFVAGAINSAGMARWNFTIPSAPTQPIWAQAIFFDTCSPTGFKFSQALGFM